MENAPRVEIQFLIDYELSFDSMSEENAQSDITELNLETNKFKGKKGFHLCGGSVDPNSGEVTGCLLDGTFTLYSGAENSYKGYLGNTYSGSDYTFSTPQYIEFATAMEGAFIKDIFVYFDSVANEYATELYFADAIKLDGTTDTTYDSTLVIKNNKPLFVFNFGEDSQIKSIKLYIKKWSKKGALVKITKITTGFKGVYDYKTLQEVSWDNDMYSNEEEIQFGISSNSARVEIHDVDGILPELYAKNLLFKNVGVKIYIDDLLQGDFYINSKQSDYGSDIWIFDCVDMFSLQQDEIVPAMEIRHVQTTIDGQVVYGLPLKTIIDWVVDTKGLNVEYSAEALQTCQQTYIPTPFIRSQQTIYDVLLKVCQVGLLRMYSKNNVLRIVKGV